MCLITEQQKPLIAAEDMTVYKLLRDNKSRHQFFEYEFDKLYQTTIEESGEWCCADNVDSSYLDELCPNWFLEPFPTSLKCFGQGYHSYLTIERLKRSSLYKSDAEIFKCTIPKGSEYYLNPTDLVISNQIIIHKNS